jgi:hypothetical protein
VDAEDLLPPQPPPDLRRFAHVAGNGELLWPRSAAVDAAGWAAGEGYGIWGGEVFSPRGPFTAMMIREWRTEPEWSAGEPWPEFIARALEQTLTALETMDEQSQEGLLYFLAYGPQSTFDDESRRTRHTERGRWLEFPTEEVRSDG